MGKTSYQDMSALVKEISDQLQQLNSGNLTVDEVEALVNNAREIYERLVVVRHKAYENLGEPKAKAVIAKPAPQKATEPIVVPVAKKAEPAPQNEPEAEEVKPFDFTAFEDDSAKKVPEPKISKPFSSIAADFDFSEDAFESPAAEDKPVEPVVAKEVKKPIDVIRAEVKPEVSSMHEKFMKEEEPLNTKLKGNDPQPLRKKIAKTVTDLRSEIGIGKKFEYINFLFGGDAKAYETGIDALNAAPDRESARAIINDFTETYNWNTEEKTIIKFIELVERKFK